MRGYWNIILYGNNSGEAVALHKGHDLLAVFKFVEGWDVHDVKIVDWVD